MEWFSGNINLLSPRSGGQKSEIRVFQRRAVTEGAKRVRSLSSSFRCSKQSGDDVTLVTWLSSLCVSSTPASLCAHLSEFPKFPFV